MKFTKLSLVAALAVSSAFAGGDITPVEPVVEAPVAAEACNSNTTINGKAVAYYISADGYGADLFDKDSSAFATAVTLDVSHKITENFTANFTAVGYANLFDNYMEGGETGAFLNVANITATFGDTTLVAGRQLLDTPMLGGFDWLLAPGSFEAYTLVNKSISNLTLVASYVAKWRDNSDFTFGDGDEFTDLTDFGDHWTIGASYSDAFDASIWYYNVDAFGYTQVYADAGIKFSGVNLAGQFISTNHEFGDDSTAFGAKVSTAVSGFDIMAAFNNVDDNWVGYVGRDSLYTSSWNTFASWVGGTSFKIEAAKEFGALAATASYAYYEYDQGSGSEDGHEFDLILGYGITDCVSVDAIYSNTDYGNGENINQLELAATYKF